MMGLPLQSPFFCILHQRPKFSPTHMDLFADQRVGTSAADFQRVKSTDKVVIGFHKAHK